MIAGKRVRLRSLELSDLDAIMKHWNDIELRNLVANADRGPMSRSDEEEWIRNTWKQRMEKKGYTLAIETLADKKAIGSVALFGIDWTSRSAEFGICIYDPEYRGKGFGEESANLILGFGFRALNLERVELQTLDTNKRAQRCYLSVGFREVGSRRKASYIDGQYHDMIIMDLLREEWLKKTEH